MKVILVLLVTVIAAQAAPSDPGSAAIDFLEKVRLRKLNLEPGGDTALSPQTADSKKRKIAKSLERLARDLGSDPLEVGAVKLDEDFAAVLVRKVGGFDPHRLQVFPVALVSAVPSGRPPRFRHRLKTRAPAMRSNSGNASNFSKTGCFASKSWISSNSANNPRPGCERRSKRRSRQRR